MKPFYILGATLIVVMVGGQYLLAPAPPLVDIVEFPHVVPDRSMQDMTYEDFVDVVVESRDAFLYRRAVPVSQKYPDGFQIWLCQSNQEATSRTQNVAYNALQAFDAQNSDYEKRQGGLFLLMEYVTDDFPRGMLLRPEVRRVLEPYLERAIASEIRKAAQS